MLNIAWIYHQLFFCCRRVENILFSPPKKDDDSVPSSSLPWMWIGALLEDGNTVDYTNIVNDSLEYGAVVTPKWLEDLTGATNVTWKYLDSKTLEEREFPSDGFVIDDPAEQDPEESDEQ